MPELPEVETIVRELCHSKIIGKKIVQAKVFWPRSIAIPDFTSFIKKILGQTILSITRRGKFLIFRLSEDTLLVHLRMTGKFTLSTKQQPISSHERVQLVLSDHRTLHYEDQRKFGKWYLLENPEDKLNKLGLEPLSKEFTLAGLQNLLKKSSLSIKAFLLNQRYIVGLGNIYVDEALWAAKIHPQQKAKELTKKQVIALHKAIPVVLQQGIDHMGTSLGNKQANYFSVSGRRGGNQHRLKVFRREGLPCPLCQTTLVKLIVAQRGTHICPCCQKMVY